MIDKNNLPDSTDEPFQDKSLIKDRRSSGKGMRPMPSADMINFLHWLQRTHPEIGRIREVSEQQWQQIAAERGIPPKILTTSISAMRNKSFHQDGYDEVRAVQRDLDL